LAHGDKHCFLPKLRAFLREIRAAETNVPDIHHAHDQPTVDIFVKVPRLEPGAKLRCTTERDSGGAGSNVARSNGARSSGSAALNRPAAAL